MKERIQAFAGSMMIPIILLVIAGIFIGIGAAFVNMENVDALHLTWLIKEGGFIHSVFALFNDIGFMIMGFLPIFFAVGLSFGLAKKEKGWAAFSGVVLFLGINTVINSMLGINGWDEETTAVEALIDSGYSKLDAQNFNSLFGSVMGIFTYDMSIFSGLITGIVTSFVHNKYCEKELPNALSFFAGPRYVMILISIIAVPLGLVLYYVWPFIGTGLASISNFITTSGLIGTFVFGAVDRALLPVGLHHLIAFPIEYTKIGAEMSVDGTVFEGVRNIMLAQMGSPDETEYIVRNFTTGRILFHFGGLPGAAFAMYMTAKKENRKKVASIMIPAILTAVLIGVTEPIEYTFLFVQPLLYFLIHVPLSGLSYVLTEAMNVSIMGIAVRDMFANLLQPQKVHALALLFLIPIYFLAYYFSFRWAILKFNIKTPGREDKASDSIIKLYNKKDYKEKVNKAESSEENATNERSQFINAIIEGFGGADNIVSVTNCATRLRVKVKDGSKVVDKETWVNELGAKGTVLNKKACQIIYGTEVITIARQVKDELGYE